MHTFVILALGSLATAVPVLNAPRDAMAAASPKALMSRAAPGSVGSIKKRAPLMASASIKNKRDLDLHYDAATSANSDDDETPRNIYLNFDINILDPDVDIDSVDRDVDIDSLDPDFDDDSTLDLEFDDDSLDSEFDDESSLDSDFDIDSLDSDFDTSSLDPDFDTDSFDPYTYDPSEDPEMDPQDLVFIPTEPRSEPTTQPEPVDFQYGPDNWSCRRGEDGKCRTELRFARRAPRVSNNKRDDTAPAPAASNAATGVDNSTAPSQPSGSTDAATNSPVPANGTTSAPVDGPDSAGSSTIIVLTGPTDIPNPIAADDSASGDMIQVPAEGSGLPAGTMIIIPDEANKLSADDAADLLDGSDLSLVAGCAGLDAGSTASVDDDGHCIVEGADEGVSLDSLQS